MQNFFLSVVFLLLSLSLGAQNSRLDLGLAHQWNALDRDAALTVTKYWGHEGLRVGLHFFQHTAQPQPDWYRPRARTFGQRIGFSLAYEHRIDLPDGNLEVYPFCGLQYFNISYVQQDEQFQQFVEEPSSILHIALGVLGKVKVHRRIYLQGSAGLGPEMIWGDRGLPASGFFGFGGLGGTFALGAAWRFGE